MAYVSLYRKYRSQTFSDLVGQDHVVRTLQNAIETGRIAHSYLFTGPRGTGKTSTARLLAKALCCEDGPSINPDENSEICRSIAEGSCIDVIEMDAASDSGVDDIRDRIVEVVEYKPMVCRYKVFIIDEVHDLSSKAFDALLKTIEEPPEHVIFILATTEFNKVPPTIRSRCQRFEFHRASMNDLVGRLQHVLRGEGIESEPAAVTAIARMADGGYRDALTLLEQAILTSNGTLTLRHVYDQLGLVSDEAIDGLLVAIKDANVKEIMCGLEQIARLGRDPRSILESMLLRLADLTRAAFEVDSGNDATADAALHEAATRIGIEVALRLRGQLAEAHKVIRDISLPRLWLESELVRIALKPATIVNSEGRASEPRKAETRPVEAKSAPVRPAPVPETTAEAETIYRTDSAHSPAPAAPPENPPLIEDPWQPILAEVLKVSKALKQKISDATILREEGEKMVVGMASQVFHSWLLSKPAAIEVIANAVAKVRGRRYDLDFVLVKQEVQRAEPTAVELPLEGARLEQLVRETFGDPSKGLPPPSESEA